MALPPGGTPRFATRIFSGMVWSYASLVGVRVLVLVSTAILAHLLSPRAFGLVALALIFTTVLDAIRDVGLNQALVVAAPEDLEDQADTAFSFSVLFGVALAVVVAAASPLAARFFHEPRLTPLLAVLGLTLPLRSLGITQFTLAQRELDFRSRTLAELCEVVVRGGLGIGLALGGLGPWSLVLGYVGGTAAWTIGVWVLVDWRPRLRLRTREIRPLLRFGGALTIIELIGTGMSYVDNLFVGRVLGPAALGRYTLGYRLPELLIVDVVAAAGLVLFPAFATLDREALRRAVVVASQYALLIGLPVAVALVALADPIVLALFGRRWLPAAPVIRILAVGFVGWPLGQVAGSAFRATRRVGVMLKLAIPQGLLLVAALAVFVHDGTAAVAGCQAGVRILFVAIGVRVSTRILGIRARALWDVAWPPLVAAAGMAVVMVPVEHAISSPWPALVICSVLGGAVYLGLAWLLAGDALPRVWRLVLARAAAPQAEGAPR